MAHTQFVTFSPILIKSSAPLDEDDCSNDPPLPALPKEEPQFFKTYRTINAKTKTKTLRLCCKHTTPNFPIADCDMLFYSKLINSMSFNEVTNVVLQRKKIVNNLEESSKAAALGFQGRYYYYVLSFAFDGLISKDNKFTISSINNKIEKTLAIKTDPKLTAKFKCFSNELLMGREGILEKALENKSYSIILINRVGDLYVFVVM